MPLTQWIERLPTDPKTPRRNPQKKTPHRRKLLEVVGCCWQVWRPLSYTGATVNCYGFLVINVC